MVLDKIHAGSFSSISDGQIKGISNESTIECRQKNSENAGNFISHKNY